MSYDFNATSDSSDTASWDFYRDEYDENDVSSDTYSVDLTSPLNDMDTPMQELIKALSQDEGLSQKIEVPLYNYDYVLVLDGIIYSYLMKREKQFISSGYHFQKIPVFSTQQEFVLFDERGDLYVLHENYEKDTYEPSVPLGRNQYTVVVKDVNLIPLIPKSVSYKIG